MRLIAINRALTHDNHVINRDNFFSSIDSPNIYTYIHTVPPLHIRRVRNLHRAPTPKGAPSQLLKKKNAIPASATARTSCLRLNANDNDWWTTMPMKRHQQSGAKKKKKKRMKTKPLCHFQVGYIHNPVKLFWVLRLITSFNITCR